VQATTASRQVNVHSNPIQDFNQTAPPAPTFEVGNNQFESHFRDTTGGQTVGDSGGTPAYPNAWVRLQRVGQTINEYYSADATNWTAMTPRDLTAAGGPQWNNTLLVGPEFCPEINNIADTQYRSRRYLTQVRFNALSVPYLENLSSFASGVTLTLQDSSNAQVNTNSIKLTFNGTSVTPVITRPAGTNLTIISYVTAAPLASGSTNTLTLVFADSNNVTQTIPKTFVVAPYIIIPADYGLKSPPTDQGLNAQVNQINFVRAGYDENAVGSAEQQWAHGYIDPTTGNPFPNVASNQVMKVDYVNWNGTFDNYWSGTDVGVEYGDFKSTSAPPQNVQDQDFPGVCCGGIDPRPGVANGTGFDNFVFEVTAYLQLKAGFYRMGVNSDDGFKVSAAPGEPSPFGIQLGVFSGGRGSATTTFDFVVAADGYYPFRLLYWQGSGDANLEWFTVDPSSGNEYLINYNNANSVKAYRAGSARARVASVLPANGMTAAEVNAPIKATLVDDLTSVVSGSIQLWVDGNSVTPTVSKSGTTTSVSYNSPGYTYGSVHTANLIWTESTTPPTTWTNTFSFTTRTAQPADLPANSFWVEAEDFDNGGTSLPAVSVMPYAGGAYDGIGAKLNIDYFNNDNVGTDTSVKYRSVGDPATPNTGVDFYDNTGQVLGASRPGGFTMTTDYAIGWGDSADWYNYTRTVPNGIYTAMVALSNGGSTIGTAGAETGTLSLVTSGVGTTSQTLKTLGNFSGASSGTWGVSTLVPLFAPDGSTAYFKANGTMTFRFNLGSGDYDWWVLIPVTNGVPPKVTSASPANGTGTGHQKSTLDLTIVDFNTAVVTNSIKLTLNGVDVTSKATISKAGDTTTVHYAPATPFATWSTNTYSLVYSDNGSPAKFFTNSTTFTVYTTADDLPANSFWIESVDFDNGGKSLPVASVMPYAGSAYNGLGATYKVDYFNNDNNDNLANVKYRGVGDPATAGISVDIESNNNLRRPGGYDLTVNYDIGWGDAGEWYNFTRTVPNGTYTAYVAMSDGGNAAGTANGMGGSLAFVTSGVGTTNQTLTQLGSFTGPSSGTWNLDILLPMTDSSGNTATFTAGGVETLRFTMGKGVNFDWFVLVPTSAANKLTATLSAGKVNLSWTGAGTLQEATALPSTANSPNWVNSASQTNPQTITPSGGAKYYRLKQ